jgi:hypothetical protein
MAVQGFESSLKGMGIGMRWDEVRLSEDAEVRHGCRRLMSSDLACMYMQPRPLSFRMPEI